MTSQSFTSPEVGHLHPLIKGNQTNELIKDEEIKDKDILFFSQYGHLEGTESDNFQILGEIENNLPDNLIVTQEQLQRDLNKADSFPVEAVNLGLYVTKKEPFIHFANTKYKEMDGKCVRIFECGICGKEFGHHYTLMRHLPTHTDERKFHCLTCGKSFRQMSTLSQHRAIHSTERPYICEVCNKTFNRVSTLISHRKTHTGIKPYRCHLCNKAFHQKGNLRNHVFTHTNERPYRCDICEKGFNQMSNLMCHKLKAHQNQSELTSRYTCKVCGEEFLKRASLRQHEQFMHGMVGLDSGKSSNSDYTHAIIVDPIKTEAMRMATEAGDTPFALLRPLSGIPVLVRVLPAGDKQMLVPATAEDLKKYGHISIRPKIAEPSTEDNSASVDGAPKAPPKTTGCIVQIKVPVVATVIQRTTGKNGPISMNVVSPGPGEIIDERGGNMADLTTDSFVYSSTLTGDVLGDRGGEKSGANEPAGHISGIDAMTFDDKFDHMMSSIANAEIEFIDQSGKILNDHDFQDNLDINSLEFSYGLQENININGNFANVDKNSEEFLILNDIQLNNIKEDQNKSILKQSFESPVDVTVEKMDLPIIEL